MHMDIVVSIFMVVGVATHFIKSSYDMIWSEFIATAPQQEIMHHLAGGYVGRLLSLRHTLIHTLRCVLGMS
jgi:hypothetical protein